MNTGGNKSLDPNHWFARFYHDDNGDIRNKITRGPGKRQQKGEIATNTMGSLGYLQVVDRINGERVWVYAHRLAVFLHTGEDPGDMEINHKNQDKADNRIKNLEVLDCTSHKRKHPKLSTCTSGVTGVSWNKRDKIWQVLINIDGKRTNLGNFKNKADAVKCRKAADIEHGYAPEHGMSPEEVREYYEDLEAKEKQKK